MLPTQLVIDGIQGTQLMHHGKKKKRIACQIVVVAQSTAYFATCTMKSPSPEWLETGGDLGPHCRPKSTNKQPVIIEGAK
jgi:hypothetical protein